jgi:hypothetical protein
MTVVIANERTEPERVAHPGYLAPVSVAGGTPISTTPLDPGQVERWQPELSPAGPVSIVLSIGSRRAVVYRNGVEIGRARISFTGTAPITSHALVLTEGASSSADPYVPDAARYRWLRIGVPGHMGEAGTQVDPEAVARLRIPADFVRQVNAILTPGATVFVTAQPLSPTSTGPSMQVVDADPPAGEHPERL